MTLRGLYHSWNEFFFKPQSPTPVCLFRIFYGLIVIADLVMLHPEWLMWYGPHALVSLATTHLFNHGPNMNLIEIIPQTDLALMMFYWAFLASAVMLTTGYMTRFNAVTVYLCLGSIEMRNGFILNSGDTLMLVCGFFLMFAPSGAAFSVDRWLAIRRGKVSAASVPLSSPWARHACLDPDSRRLFFNLLLEIDGHSVDKRDGRVLRVASAGFSAFPGPGHQQSIYN